MSAGTPDETTVSINDDDKPTSVSVSFVAATYTVAEDGSAAVVVTLSDDPEQTVTIPITAAEQGGASNADYGGVPASVVFNAGETSKTITFTAASDSDNDDGESVKLGFGTLPIGVSEGAIKETSVTITESIAAMVRHGISVPQCVSNGISMYWEVAPNYREQDPPHGWRVERRHWNSGAWVDTIFDFLGPEADALQTHDDQFWDWTDTAARRGIAYTYRVHALDDNGALMNGRRWSRRAPVTWE